MSTGHEVAARMREIMSIPDLAQRERALREYLESVDPVVRETIEAEMRRDWKRHQTRKNESANPAKG